MDEERVVWIDWGRHLRTHTICGRLDLTLLEFAPRGSRLSRYFKCAIKTTQALRRLRPRVVIATNPSIALGFLLLFLRPILRFRIISDAHYVGVTIPTRPYLQWILDLHNRLVDVVIITNDGHRRRLADLGARPFVLPDPLPALDKWRISDQGSSNQSVFLICSFAGDEPFAAVFEAFRTLAGAGFRLLVSGNYGSAGIRPSDYPWVELLGFVAEHEYYQTLNSSAVAMDLTIRDELLVCGAYEALALRKPLILSDTRTNRDYFGESCVLTEVDAVSIRRAVSRAYQEREALANKVEHWVEENEAFMGERLRKLQSTITSLA